MAGVVGAVLGVSGAVFAQTGWLLDDLEHGGNRNALGGYWYTYNDHSILTNHVEGSFTPIAGGNAGSNFAAAMHFQGLAAAAAVEEYATVGMGTEISGDENIGYGAGFNSVTAISFYARGPAGLVFNFNVETIENAQSGSTHVTDNSYTRQFTIAPGANNVWTLYTVQISPVTAPSQIDVPITGESTFGGAAGDLQQEPWHGRTFQFRPENVTQLSWSLKSYPNNQGARINSGTFAVDDIRLVGFEYVEPDPLGWCGNGDCVLPTFATPDQKALLSDFEFSPAGRNTLGFYWYDYVDASSQVVTEISYTAPGRLDGSAASASFNLGTGTSPFAGIGTTLYNEEATPTVYLDASNFRYDFGGIYFEYMTGNTNNVKVELHDWRSVEEDNGEDFFVLLPGTGGQWMSATIPFERFVLPAFAFFRDLSLSNLAKLQFVFNTPGPNTITIDNVYFYGADEFKQPHVSVAAADRDIPRSDDGEWTVIIPPAVVTAGEFIVGPSPISRLAGPVNFFWTGREVRSGRLIVYDAAGNTVKRISVRNGVVSSWDLTDSRGRPVSEGAYLVKGVLTTVDGKREKVSARVGVVR
jgi:hypothetical protein